MSFNETNVANAPIQSGVYALGDGNELIYYGKAEGERGIQQELSAKLTNPQNPCIAQNAREFCYHIVDNAREVETSLLEQYQRKYGRLPKCNAQV